jgi:hypothetical protein
MIFLIIACDQPCQIEFEADYKETADRAGYIMTLEVQDKETKLAYDAYALTLLAESVVEASYELNLPNMDRAKKEIENGHVLIVSDDLLYNQLFLYPYLYDENSDFMAKEVAAGFTKIKNYNARNLDCITHSNADNYLIVMHDTWANKEEFIVHEFSHLIGWGTSRDLDTEHANTLFWEDLMDLALELYYDKLTRDS